MLNVIEIRLNCWWHLRLICIPLVWNVSVWCLFLCAELRLSDCSWTVRCQWIHGGLFLRFKKKKKGGQLRGDGGIDKWISLMINTVFPSWILSFRPFSPPWCWVIGVHWKVGGVRRKHVQLLHQGIVIKKHFSAETHTIQMRFFPLWRPF